MHRSKWNSEEDFIRSVAEEDVSVCTTKISVSFALTCLGHAYIYDFLEDFTLRSYVHEHQQSFNEVEGWMEEIKQRKAKKSILILVGLKTDKSDRVIQADAAQKLAKKNDYLYLEASSLSGTGAAEVFITAASKFHKIDPPPKPGEFHFLFLRPVAGATVAMHVSSVQALPGLLICYYYCYFLCYIPVPARQEVVSRAQSRRILDVLIEGVHRVEPGCPKVLISPSESNHSDLLPLNPDFEKIFRQVVPISSLQSSYATDMDQAAAFSELIITWLITKGHLERQGSEVRGMLQPMMRAFLQIPEVCSVHESITGMETRGGSNILPTKSLIRSVAFCLGRDLVAHATTAKPSGIQDAPVSVGAAVSFGSLPRDLCAQMKLVEGVVIRLSETRRIHGFWAPLHCFQTALRNPILLHLVVLIPSSKAAK
ncbi:unnamed protein product [Schistocephalus solidus]|uniref:Retinol dehydrogenase 14 n=1 Tax=Schistocephalus solidus TaxID=70667 RepID=A0A183SP96_SCHSO|nr:unnamed protein product [Schistocephalus solidus]